MKRIKRKIRKSHSYTETKKYRLASFLLIIQAQIIWNNVLSNSQSNTVWQEKSLQMFVSFDS